MKTQIIGGIATLQLEDQSTDLVWMYYEEIDIDATNQKLAEYFKARTCIGCDHYRLYEGNVSICHDLGYNFEPKINPRQFSCNSWQEKGEGK